VTTSSSHIPIRRQGLLEGKLHLYFTNSICIITDLINALLGNCSVNTAQLATVVEAVFSVDPTGAPIEWLDIDHVICVYCRPMSVRVYHEMMKYISVLHLARKGAKSFHDFQCNVKWQNYREQ
jgi:hypothetical protein